MIGELITLPVRAAGLATRLSCRAAERTLNLASEVVDDVILLVGPGRSNDHLAEGPTEAPGVASVPPEPAPSPTSASSPATSTEPRPPAQPTERRVTEPQPHRNPGRDGGRPGDGPAGQGHPARRGAYGQVPGRRAGTPGQGAGPGRDPSQPAQHRPAEEHEQEESPAPVGFVGPSDHPLRVAVERRLAVSQRFAVEQRLAAQPLPRQHQRSDFGPAADTRVGRLAQLGLGSAAKPRRESLPGSQTKLGSRGLHHHESARPPWGIPSPMPKFSPKAARPGNGSQSTRRDRPAGWNQPT
jgi:hypothetical protein